MAMKPSAIRSLMATAEELTQTHPAAAFLVAWSAWEAYVYRIVVVSLEFQGLPQSAAIELAEQRALWKREKREAVLRELFGKNPSSLKGDGTVWRGIYDSPQTHTRDRVGSTRSRSLEKRRHHLIHGIGTVRPTSLIEGVNRLLDAINLPLFGQQQILIRAGSARGDRVAIGSVLVARRGGLGPRRGSALPAEVAGEFGWS